MDIAVTLFDATDDVAAEHAYRIRVASLAAEAPDFPPPSRPSFLGGLRNPMPDRLTRYALAYLDGEPVGYLAMTLPQLDNLNNASADVLCVHPDYRRRGVGRALYGYLLRFVGDLGRSRIVVGAVETLPGGAPRDPAGTAFALAMGAKPALDEIRRRLDLTALDESELDRLRADAATRSPGYSLVSWHGPASEEYLDDLAYLDGRLAMDAPLGDLEREPDKVDADRIRGVERVLVARGMIMYHCAARHDATGRLVAWTLLEVDASDRWYAKQQITIVDPRHRGRRLGTLVKIDNLRRVRAAEPDLRIIDTWNADSNDHMISINEAMGYRPVDTWRMWQQKI